MCDKKLKTSLFSKMLKIRLFAKQLRKQKQFNFAFLLFVFLTFSQSHYYSGGSPA